MKTPFLYSIFTIFSFISFTHTPAQIITTIAGTGIGGHTGDGGPATNAEIFQIYGFVTDRLGNLFIAEPYYHSVRKISISDTITTVAGNGTVGYAGDGGLAISAELVSPTDLAMDRFGNLYIADDNTNTIRKIDTTGIITTVAGTGFAGYNGDGIPATAAQINRPSGVCVDGVGNIYVADVENNRLRKIDTFGMITTIAGTGVSGYVLDGSVAATSQIKGPYRVRIDKSGNLFVIDSNLIRKISTAGILMTVAGDGTTGFSGDGGVATAAAISAETIALDTFGNIYIADAINNRIRKVNTAGLINTIAGTGVSGFFGDGGSPLLAELCAPVGIALNSYGDIYIGDACNVRVRYITSRPLTTNYTESGQLSVTVTPNPSRGTFAIAIPENRGAVDISIANVLGEKLIEMHTIASKTIDIQLNAPPGLYFLTASSQDKRFSQRVIVK